MGGIGPDGHIAFNEPGSSLESLTRIKTLTHDTIIANEEWPIFDEDLTKDDEVTIVVQVNGKLRAKLAMPAGISKEDMEKAAFADDNIKTHTDGKNIVKVIAVPGKLVNIVAK